MRWLSLSTGAITAVASLLLASLSEDLSCVAAHSRPLSPFVRNDVRRSASATAITSMVPRGGASRVPRQGSVVLPSSRSSSTKTGLSDDVLSSQKSSGWLTGGANIKDLIPREKRGWAIALVFSVIYLMLLLSKSKFGSCDYSPDGFCVTNFDPTIGKAGECLAQNSHLWAWKEDVIFTVLAFVIGFMTKTDIKSILGVAAAIFGHGFLHNSLSNNACKPAGAEGGSLAANVAYAVFTAGISYLTIILAGLGTAATVLVTLFVTFVTVYLSQPAQGLGVSPIFMTTQLLASFVGVTAKPGNTEFSALTGDLFVLPCLVSILELIFCCSGSDSPGLFNKIGGHAWYDFFLHIAFLSTLFPDKSKKAST